MAIKWTRPHSIRVDLPPDADADKIRKNLRGVQGVTGCDSSPTVLTVGFAHRYSTDQLRRGPYRNVRRLLIDLGVITPSMRAQAAA